MSLSPDFQVCSFLVASSAESLLGVVLILTKQNKNKKLVCLTHLSSCPITSTEPQEDHALIMVRFARDCMYKSYELTKKLEVTLGPDTAELSMRFGLHR